MPGRDSDAYTRVMLSMLPRGALWSRDPDTVRGRVYAAHAAELARIDALLEQLLSERSPRTAFALLAEWETALGLPDECTGTAVTIAERRAAALARLIATGGQSPAYFVEVAKALGYDITITQYRGRWYGLAKTGGTYGTADHHFTWKVTCTTGTTRPRRYGQAYYGEPYTTWGNYPLVCMIRRLAPAHTTVLFD